MEGSVQIIILIGTDIVLYDEFIKVLLDENTSLTINFTTRLLLPEPVARSFHRRWVALRATNSSRSNFVTLFSI